MLEEKQLDSLDIVGFLNDGDVDFGRSDTESEPCKTYFIEGYVQKKAAVLRVRNCRDKATVEALMQE